VAVDAAVGECFTEVHRDVSGGTGRREELQIAKGDAAEIDPEHVGPNGGDLRGRLLHQPHRCAAGGRQGRQHQGCKEEGQFRLQASGL